MPPSKRRRTNASAVVASKQQQTLSFRSTKSNAQDGTVELPEKTSQKPGVEKLDSRPAKASTTPKQIDVEVLDADETNNFIPDEKVTEPAAAAVERDVEQDLEEVEEEEEQYSEDEDAKAKAAERAELDRKALAISDAKIKSYWNAKERERKAPRVHQQGLSLREKILREWDMSTRYGPSIGISRIGRWRRAHDLGMDPPIEVLCVLLKEERAKSGKGDTEAEKSIMDELILSSRLIEA